ncbi:MAG: DNA translocase FtsK [Candidatus Omnitrophota bacterium]
MIEARYRLGDNQEETGVVIFSACSVRKHVESKVWSEVGLLVKRTTNGQFSASSAAWSIVTAKRYFSARRTTLLLQRRLKIGYGRAARMLDLMEERGIVGPPRGNKPREVVMNNLT